MIYCSSKSSHQASQSQQLRSDYDLPEERHHEQTERKKELKKVNSTPQTIAPNVDSWTSI